MNATMPGADEVLQATAFAVQSPAEDDEQLKQNVEAAKHGDQFAFGALVAQFHDDVFRQALRVVRRPERAEDLTQDTFFLAWRKLDHLRANNRFGPWVRRIAFCTALNSVRGKRPDVSLDAVGSEGVDCDDPISRILYDENDSVIGSCIERLGEMDRESLHAFYWEGESLIQMSEHFECPIGTVKRRLHVARQRLLKQLLASGYFDPNFSSSNN